MIPMLSDTVTLEHVWEAQARPHLFFGDEAVVSVCWLADYEFADLLSH